MAVRSAPDTERSETARRGTEIYERDIKPTLGDDQDGRYVSIDVDSGCWAVADSHREAVDELYEQHPDSHDVWSLRVGHQALFSLGGRPLREEVASGEVSTHRAAPNSGKMAAPGRTQADRTETGRRGTEIYERDIKPTLGDDQDGRYVSIDVDTGGWTIAGTRRSSIDELYERYPDARNVWMLRVGYRTLINLGGRPLRGSE